MQDEELTPAEHELETALAGLRPTGGAIDRDRLMFQAGRASMRRGTRLWQVTTTLLAVSLTTSVLVRPAPREFERVVYVTADTSPLRKPVLTAPESPRQDWGLRPAQGSYLKLRDEVLERGLAALPVPHASFPDDIRQSKPRGQSSGIPLEKPDDGPHFLGMEFLQDQGERL